MMADTKKLPVLKRPEPWQHIDLDQAWAMLQAVSDLSWAMGWGIAEMQVSEDLGRNGDPARLIVTFVPFASPALPELPERSGLPAAEGAMTAEEFWRQNAAARARFRAEQQWDATNDRDLNALLRAYTRRKRAEQQDASQRPLD